MVWTTYRLLLLVFACFVLACQNSEQQGFLQVLAPKAGSYEIYDIVGGKNLQFVAQHTGAFNKEVPLPPGRYLVLADCSHQLVTIYPREISRLSAHMINFLPPTPPQEGDLFTIQCSRYQKSHLRQQLHNRYVLFLIDQAEELLVGMTPLSIPLKAGAGAGKLPEPQVITLALASLQVTADPGMGSGEVPYFVSPTKNLAVITQGQKMQRRQFLLPGSYVVGLNGSALALDLKAGEERSISAAGLRLSTSPRWNAETFTQVRGSPFHVEFNEGGHVLLPDTTYAVLPGKGQLSLVGESVSKGVELVSAQVSEVPLHSVLVESGCSPWEWDCLGKREVSLYRQGEQYPFLESITDVPIPYFAGDIYLGVEGSSGLRYHIEASARDTVLHLGKITFVPQAQHQAGHVTELVRLEALHNPYVGYSFDIEAEGPSTLTVIAGSYVLSRYFTTNSFDGRRSQIKQTVNVRPGGLETVEVSYFLSENKAKIINEKMSKWLAKRNRQHFDQLRRRQEIAVF